MNLLMLWIECKQLHDWLFGEAAVCVSEQVYLMKWPLNTHRHTHTRFKCFELTFGSILFFCFVLFWLLETCCVQNHTNVTEMQ